ncbi:MAG: DMT family transporter [Geodermatophilaceae bacterium]|nr:DMT family transporter [Geodermatophilaceae bacterium]
MDTSRARLLAALAAVALWSTNAYAADLALSRMGLGWLLVVQFGTAAAALLAVRAVHRRRATAAGTASRDAESGAAALRPMTAILGVVGLTGTIFLQYLAFATAPIVAANVLAYGWPLLAALGIAATRRNRHALLSTGLAIVGFGGVVLIFTSPADGADASVAATASWGYLAAVGSAACMAVYTFGAGGTVTSPFRLLIPAALTGTVAAGALVAFTDGPAPTSGGVLAAVYLGLGPMAAGYALWTFAMARGGVVRLSPLGYTTPLLSTLLLLAAGAPATTSTLAGVGLVLACSLGVLVTNITFPRRRTGPRLSRR